MVKETAHLQWNTIYDETPRSKLIVVLLRPENRCKEKQHWPIDFGSMFSVHFFSIHYMFFGCH